MEVEAMDDIIKSPLSEVSNMFSQDDSVIRRLTDVGQHFRSRLNDHLSKIPAINNVPLESVPSNSLVYFRGMIQDMLDPEFYYGRYNVTDKTTKEKTIKFGCYTDINEKQNEEINFDNSFNITLERQTYFCVSVPGENKWLKDMLINNSSSMNSVSSKNKKRVHEACDNVNEESTMDVDNGTSSGKEKRLKSDGGIQNGSATTKKNSSGDVLYKCIPLPNEDGIPCFITMYSDFSDLKLNDVIEFVGIFSPDSHYNAGDMDADNEEMPACDEIHIPSYSTTTKVPSIHCIFFNKLSTLNPAITMKSDIYESTLKELSSVRNDLIQFLTNVFGGDVTVAEYFLIHLISNTYAIVGTLCVGKFSMNITKCGEKLPQILYSLMQKVVEKSYFLPLTVENLNKMTFSPKKDFKANKLLSGILQLSDGTNLVLDETAMQPGTLDSAGLNNLKSIGNLIQWQNVEYDFKFSKVEMRTDVNVLIFSEGKSMIKCDCHIPIVSEIIDTEKAKLLIDNINPALLEKLRIYLSVIRSLEFNLTEEVSKALEEDFVDMRKQDAKVMTAEVFSLLLTTARYMALSYGQNTLDAPLWTRAKELDGERRKRST